MSSAVAPDDQGFVSASSWTTRRYNLDGKQLWWQENESIVWDVAITGDGQLVVTVDGRGVVQWRSYETGELLLNLFAHVDGKRWVAWTPSGYYDASPGGESLIGWHVNRGTSQAADFYPASQFREHFFRPDIVDQVLTTRNETLAVELANRAAGRKETSVSVDRILPPIVEIVSAIERFSETSVPIRVRVNTADDAPLTRMRVVVNGEIMPNSRAPRSFDADGSERLLLSLPPKDSEVTIYADNRYGTSQPVKLEMKWAGDKKVFVAGEQGLKKKNTQPNLWLLAVGVSKYKDANVRQLDFAHVDAMKFAETLSAQKGKAYAAVATHVLTNEQATTANVLNGLKWLKANVGEGDVGVAFLAGHGFTMATDHQYFFGSHDVDLKRLTETGVSYKEIKDALVEFNLRGGGTRAVFFIDTCHAGDATGSRLIGSVKASNGDTLAAELTRQENQVLVFASSKGDQLSWEDPKIGHGAFTKAIIEGLGEEWRGDLLNMGQVTYKGLDTWISARVPSLTHNRQTPRLLVPSGGVDDFPIAIK